MWLTFSRWSPIPEYNIPSTFFSARILNNFFSWSTALSELHITSEYPFDLR